MPRTTLKKKTVKDLSIDEFKHLMQEIIADDIKAWQETFEIMSNKTLMNQITEAEKSRIEGKDADFIEWEKVKRDV